MTKYISIFFFLISIQSIAQRSGDSSVSKMVLTGIYYGKNIYVQNPLADVTNKTYCTDSVFVNGIKCTTDLNYVTNLNASAYEINLSLIVKQIIGTEVTIIIYYKKTCKPKFLIPNSLIPLGSKAELTSFEIDSTGHVHIRALNEPGGNSYPLHIDQYRALKWRTIMTIPRKYESENIYDTVIKLTAGRNTFRLSKYPYTFSSIITDVDSETPLACILDTAKMCITCSDAVYYRIEDRCMNVLDSGYAKNIDVSTCDDAYLMLYDTQLLHFEMKKKKKKTQK